VDRRKKSRENREQLRCCNWIRLPIGPIAVVAGVPPAALWLCSRYGCRHRKRWRRERGKARSQNICPVHLIL